MIRSILAAGLMQASILVLASASQAAPAYVEKAVSDTGRPAADTARDAGRLPGEMVVFAGIKPGDKVVDLLPGGGYFTRIFAKTVGPKGFVYAYYGNQYDARMKTQGKDPDNQGADLKAAYPNIGVVHGPVANFITPEPVDIVWTSDNYHDLHNAPFTAADIAAMNKAIYASLKPGGYYVVIDHRAAKGAGLASTSALHRMDEDVAKTEIEAAGFKLVAEGKALTRSSDDNTKKVFEAGEHDHTDQMMLKFQKPRH